MNLEISHVGTLDPFQEYQTRAARCRARYEADLRFQAEEGRLVMVASAALGRCAGMLHWIGARRAAVAVARLGYRCAADAERRYSQPTADEQTLIDAMVRQYLEPTAPVVAVVPCEHCEGAGWLDAVTRCSVCRGHGRTRRVRP